MLSEHFARPLARFISAASLFFAASGPLLAEPALAYQDNVPVVADTLFRNGDIHTIDTLIIPAEFRRGASYARFG